MYNGYQGNYGGYGNQPPQYQSTNAAATASLYQQHQQQQAAAAAASIYGTSSSAATGAANPYQSYPYSAATTATAAQPHHHQQHRLSDAYSCYGGYPTGNTTSQHYYSAQVGMKNVGQYGAQNYANSAQSASYSPYDAAVYAAANSYVANRKNAVGASAAANPHGWMSLTSNNRPHWGNKRRNGGGGGDSTIHYCEICKISCAGTITYKEHLEGKQHKRKEAMQNGEQAVQLAKNKVCYRCDLCNVTCAGQDTYMSHVRGKQHAKAVALCRKMGKTVPEDVPTILSKGSSGEVQETKAKSKWHQQQLPGTNKVIGINTINFVEGAKLSTTGRLEEKKKEVIAAVGGVGSSFSAKPPQIEVDDERLQAMITADSIKPVGEELVTAERDSTGKLLHYFCTICECKFSDPNAKDVHLKGRRHRVSYQKKVDPTFRVVDIKPSSRKAREAANNRVSHAHRGPWFAGYLRSMQRFNSLDERHFEEKHSSLHPGEEYLNKLERFIVETEGVLKLVSEDTENNKVLFGEPAIVKEETGKKPVPPRVLQGVMRVGTYAKNIFIKGDDLIELVVVSTPVPTKELVTYVKDSFTSHTQTMSIDVDPSSDACLIVKHSVVDLGDARIRIMLTSPTIREATEEIDCVDRDSCLTALSLLRRNNWFRARCLGIQSCQPLLRVMRDLKKRSPAWAPLDDHTIDLLIEKILFSYPCPISPADAFKTVLEAISTGLICTGILYDPCEKEKVNVFDSLNDEQKQELTSVAQTWLRLISFNQIYEVLEMDRLSDIRPSLVRKRQNEDQNGNEHESKKERLEDEEEENEEYEVEEVKEEEIDENQKGNDV